MPHSRPIVGLIGHAHAGKDSFAAVLAGRHRFERIGFADPLREAALALDPIVDYGDEDPDDPCIERRPVRYSDALLEFGYEGAKRIYPEFRRVLQRLGTDAIRALDSEFWVRIAHGRILESEAPVVVADVRFPNEADAIVAAGGTLVRILRPDAEPVLAHESETVLDDYPVETVIVNDGDLADLSEAAAAYGDRITGTTAEHTIL